MKTSVVTFSNWLKLPLGLLVAAGSLSGCGKIGDPLPPVPRRRLVVETLRVRQEGGRLVLSFPLVRTRQTRQIERIDIYRLIEAEQTPLTLTTETFENRASIIASIPAAQIPPDRSTVTYVDPLETSRLPQGARHLYAVRVIDATGARADLSSFAIIHPLAEVAAAATELRAAQEEKQIILTWKAPERNVTGAGPVNLAGYNIYRRLAGTTGPLLRLNDQPLAEARFVDRGFDFGASYEYAVRAISRAGGQENQAANDPARPTVVESDESQLLLHAAKDTFAPAAPSLVTVASINRVVSLFWPLNTEPDIAGYHIYRAEEEKGKPSAWRRINSQLHQTGSWRDERVVVGRTYFYQVTAVDRFGNESQRSDTVSEIANP